MILMRCHIICFYRERLENEIKVCPWNDSWSRVTCSSWSIKHVTATALLIHYASFNRLKSKLTGHFSASSGQKHLRALLNWISLLRRYSKLFTLARLIKSWMPNRQGLADKVENEIDLSLRTISHWQRWTLMMAVIDWKWLVNSSGHKANKWLRAKVKPLYEPDSNMRREVFCWQQN